MPSNFTLNNVLSSSSYNSNVGYNNSWVEVQNDADRPLYAQASYITNNKVSDWGVAVLNINASSYTRLPSVAANTATFINTTGVTVWVGRWSDAGITGIPIWNGGTLTLNLIKDINEIAFQSSSNNQAVYVMYSNMC